MMLARLVLVLAVLLMPFGMAPAAASVAHPSTDMAMPMGHCDQKGSTHDRKGGVAECTMVCASALPAAFGRAGERPLVICEPAQPASATPLRGLDPETATPPPRRS
jgi:hypothetical protein